MHCWVRENIRDILEQNSQSRHKIEIVLFTVEIFC